MDNYVYTIHLEPAEEGGFIVTAPALPAIVTEGDTLAEAIANAREAIECYLESLAKENRPIPREEPKVKSFDTHVEVRAPTAA